MPRTERTEVYAQIVPEPGLLSTGYRLRIVLPYGPDTTPTDVRTTWPAVERSLVRALRTARHEGGMELPNDLEQGLAIEQRIPGAVLADLSIDLARFIMPDLQRSIISAIKGRDTERRT